MSARMTLICDRCEKEEEVDPVDTGSTAEQEMDTAGWGFDSGYPAKMLCDDCVAAEEDE